MTVTTEQFLCLYLRLLLKRPRPDPRKLHSESESDSNGNFNDVCEVVNEASPIMVCICSRTESEEAKLTLHKLQQAGTVKKKGKIAFRPRYYTLTSDGNLYSARDETGNKHKHMVGFEQQASVLSVRERDLIIKGQNDQGFVNEFWRCNSAYSTGYSSLICSCILLR